MGRRGLRAASQGRIRGPERLSGTPAPYRPPPRPRNSPRRLGPDSGGIKFPEMLKSAWEVALEKHEFHEDLSRITREYLEHIAMLEECWTAIRPPEAEAAPSAHLLRAA